MAKAKGIMIHTETEEKKDDFSYEVLEDLGVLGERKGGYETRIRYMRWGNNKPGYYIRPWKQNDDGTEKYSSRCALTGNELMALRDILNEAEAE